MSSQPQPATFVGKLFRTTSIEVLRDESKRPSQLRKVLRARDLIAIGLGSMIGGGIFTTIGPGVKLAGPAIIIAFVLAGLAAFFAALCYAELGAMVPIAGSAYTYAYATLGQVVAWIIGFSLLFEYGISAAPVAQQFSSALRVLLSSFGLNLPTWAQGSHFVFHGAWYDVTRWDLGASQYDVIGALFVLALSLLLSLGIRETATTNNIFVVLKILALVVFVIFGVSLFHAQNLTPFIPLGWGALTPFSGGNGNGIIPAAALVFFSYIGFDAATTTAEECRRPQRDIPVGVMGALLIGTVIYCVVAVMLVGIVPWQKVDENAALAAALSSLLGQTRIFYVMARDRMLPPVVARIDPRTKTPVLMTMITGVAIAILTLIVPLDVLLDLVNIGTLAAFTIVCAGVLYLRRRRPELQRPFKVPFVPVFPLLGIFFSGFLAVFGLTTLTWARFLISLLIGLIIYFSYGFRFSNPEQLAMIPPELEEIKV
jgi:APA family basic amino acid/polyamine antiporter